MTRPPIIRLVVAVGELARWFMFKATPIELLARSLCTSFSIDTPSWLPLINPLLGLLVIASCFGEAAGFFQKLCFAASPSELILVVRRLFYVRNALMVAIAVILWTRLVNALDAKEVPSFIDLYTNRPIIGSALLFVIVYVLLTPRPVGSDAVS